MTIRQILTAASLTALIGCAAAPPAIPTLAEAYTCKGLDPSGDTYEVTMLTRQSGDIVSTLELHEGSVVALGAGYIVRDELVLSQQFAAGFAAARYTIKGNALDGEWFPIGTGKVLPVSCVKTEKPQPPNPTQPTEQPRVDPGQIFAA